MEVLDFSRRRGRSLIHIAKSKTDAVGGHSHTITCSVSSILSVTDLTWIKTTASGKEIVNVVGVDGKFSGGTLSDPSLTINNIAKSDEGIYVCRATTRFGTISSEDSVLACKECIEVEIIQKGPIAVGFGGTIRINASIISNSSGSLKVNWQKTQSNCCANLMINRPKYSGSSCEVNSPHLVINSIDKEDAGIYKLEVISPTETKSSPGILVELYGDEADSLSKEENNFFRLYLLCQKIATKAVRLFFDSKVPGHSLEAFLKQHKSNLTYQFSDYRCTKEQEAKLFPGGQVAVVSTDFDFSLLYKLIRNLLTAIPAPTCGWGNPPSPRHVNKTDDIERLRHFRNILSHNTEFEIFDTDFSTHWIDLSQAIDRISKGSLSTEVESMRTKKFDKCITNEMEDDMRKDLKEIREEFMELRQDVTECKTDIADNKQNIGNHSQEIHSINTRHIQPNIHKGHVELIKKWKIEDTLFYDGTGGFTAVFNMVKSKKYMTIIGGPGSGKSATARHIALQLEKQGWKVIPVCKLEDIIEYGDREHKQVFVLDDVLGTFAVEMNTYNTIFTHKEMIFTTIGQTSKLLFTCRKSLYKEASKLGPFVTEHIVDLESKSNQLTETEKMAICQHHCESKGVNQDVYTSLSFTKANHMFPFLCKIFSQDKKYQRLGESFFNKPFKYFNNELGKLQETHTIEYAVLVLCLLNKGKLSVEHLPPKHMMQEVFNICGVNLGTPDKKIKDAIYNQSETYLTRLETEYTFTHDFIFEVIAYHYGCQNKHQIFKYLSSSYIANKVTVYDQASNEDLCIHISEDMYLPLAERLYTDIQSMNLFDVFMNKSLKHRPFLDVFETMLKTKPFDEFESLILRKRQNIHHFVDTTFSFKRQVIDGIEYERLFLLFDMVFDAESNFEYNVRVISWIINYGHTPLLQEIINHVECNNLSISSVFGSDITENTRLLLLGCHSNTLDMVKLILDYVDPNYIDINFTSGCASQITEDSFHAHSTPLIVACSIGNLCIVKALLRKHANINKCNRCSESPLFTALNHGHMDIVKCLLKSGADINLGKERGQSPLLIASQRGHCDIVKCLLSNRADINLRDEGGHSPLFEASNHGHCDIVKCLVSSSADINLCNNFGQSPLIIASQQGHCNVVEYLLSSEADIDFRDNFRQSPLWVASSRGHCDVVKSLLDYDADINLCCNLGKSSLFVASQEGHCDVVKCLVSLTACANINLHSNDGQSPLIVASQRGHCDVVEYLLSSEADINFRDNLGESSLFVASQKDHGDVVKCLVSSGADINLHSKSGHSPLIVASQQGHCNVVEYLLSSEADINFRDNFGQSPLFVASSRGHCDIVKCLLRSGADINMCNNFGQSPLFVASQRGHCNVVEYLLSSEVDSNFRDNDGESPLFVASSRGHCDIVKCLLRSGADINTCDNRRQSPLIVASQRGHCDVVTALLAEYRP